MRINELRKCETVITILISECHNKLVLALIKNILTKKVIQFKKNNEANKLLRNENKQIPSH